MASFDGNKNSDFMEKIKELKSSYYEEGIAGLASQIQTLFDDWEHIHFKIAVAGRSGVGKSSFINALRGITADDSEQNPAEVNVNECTTRVQVYKYPGNDKFLLYDLPGLGTPTFKQEKYLGYVDFEQYDLFIILTASRFTNEDLWLAEQLKKNGKLFYFVRSKIENDIRSDKQAHPRTHNEAAVLDSMRTNLAANLERFPRTDIFLIDNYETQLYDFGSLTSKIIEDSGSKQDVVAFSLACLSREIIEEKQKGLKRRIRNISYKAGLFGGLYSNPFILKEIDFYDRQFGVDKTSLRSGGQASGLSEDEIRHVENQMESHDKTMSENLRQSLKSVIKFIPIAGNIVEALKCANYLEKCIDETAKQAIEIHGLMTKSLTKKCTSSVRIAGISCDVVGI